MEVGSYRNSISERTHVKISGVTTEMGMIGPGNTSPVAHTAVVNGHGRRVNGQFTGI